MTARSPGEIVVEVAAGTRERQEVVAVRVPAGTSIAEAVDRSAVLDRFPEIDRRDLAYAVFGVRSGAGQRLRDGDRVEVLRPLVVDPKEARRRRATRT